MPEISLIICTRNRDDMVDGALSSAINQSLERACYEIIVIDQSDNDKTAVIASNYSGIKYIRTDSRGLSNSRNEGINYSKGNILVFVDDDVEFENDYLLNILEFFNKSELKPDFIGGRTLIKYLAEKPEWLDGVLLGVIAHSDYGDEPLIYDNHPKHVPYGCNMAIKKESLVKIGGFSNFISSIDQKMTENEDIILANKLRQLGYILAYCPKMLVYHKMPLSRLGFDYFKKRYLSQGSSDAYIYYLLGMYTKSEILKKIPLHISRLFNGMILQYFQQKASDKYYQKLRVYYNLGYLKSLLRTWIK